MNKSKESMLICEFRVIGDAIMALPFIKSASEKYDLYIACTNHTKYIYEQFIPTNKIIPFSPPWFTNNNKLKNWFNNDNRIFIKKISSINPTFSVCSWADTRSHFIMAKSNAKKRVGFPMNKYNVIGYELNFRKKQIFFGKILNIILSILIRKPLLTKKLKRKNPEQHHVDDWKQLADFLNIKWNEKRPWFNIRKLRKQNDVRYLLKSDIDESACKWAIHPGGRVREHLWPQKLFAKAIKEIFIPKSIQAIIIKPPNFHLINELYKIAPVVKAPTMQSLLTLLSYFDGILCNDTAISHAGTALGKPVLTIFNAGNSNIFSPRGNENNVIKKQDCNCHPCIGNCIVPNIICNHQISLEEINKKVINISNIS